VGFSKVVDVDFSDTWLYLVDIDYTIYTLSLS